MEDWGLWFGFIGIIVGALITFAADSVLLRRKMRFNISVEVRKTLMDLHHNLVKKHSDIQEFYDGKSKSDWKSLIQELKPFHKEVMEIYKIFRIHFGDLYAYELNSLIYQFYYDMSKISDPGEQEFEWAYKALRDAYALMISDVRYGLLVINTLKKINRRLRIAKIMEYRKYGNRIYDTLFDSIFSFLKNYERPSKATSIDQTVSKFDERIENFRIEYRHLAKRATR